jgi:hypothetical protein
MNIFGVTAFQDMSKKEFFEHAFRVIGQLNERRKNGEEQPWNRFLTIGSVKGKPLNLLIMAQMEHGDSDQMIVDKLGLPLKLGKHQPFWDPYFNEDMD